MAHARQPNNDDLRQIDRQTAAHALAPLVAAALRGLTDDQLRELLRRRTERLARRQQERLKAVS
jgi:hypothetical protein